MANTQELDFTVWRRQPAGASSQTPVSYPGSSSKKSSSSSSNQPQYVEEDLTGAKTQTKPDEPEVRLYDGVFEEIDKNTGFQFNKKCKVKVKVDLPKGSTDRKKVTFNTFVCFDNEDEDLCQTLEGFIEEVKGDGDKKQYQAVAEMNLFYGERYYKALLNDNTVKCSYKFKATHPKAKAAVESKELEMPYEAPSNITISFENEQGEPVSNVTVEISTGEKITTDENGQILIDLSKKNNESIKIVSVLIK